VRPGIDFKGTTLKEQPEADWSITCVAILPTSSVDLGPIKKKLVYHPSHPEKLRREAVFIFFIFFAQGFAVQCGYLSQI
jgi:hypothetical protein